MPYRDQEPQRREPTEEDKKAFFERLAQADVSAIQALVLKVAPDVKQMCQKAGLTHEDTEELLNDAVVTTLMSIRKGTFQFMGFHPSSYTLGVAKKMVTNRWRSRKPQTEWIENVTLTSDFNPDIYVHNKERITLVKELLSRLGDECRKVLVLKYFDQKRDQEVVSEKLTPYTTVASLKSKRGQCLKKLREMAQKAGIKAEF